MTEITIKEIALIIMGIIIIFGILYAAIPSIRTNVNNLFIAMGGLVGLKFDTLPGGGGAGGGACDVDVSDCQLAIMHSPSLTVAQIQDVLNAASSPTIKDEPDIAEFFYSESIRTGVDDAIALAFFQHESTFGKYGKAPTTKSIGNIEYTKTCKNTYGGEDYEGFCKYPSWKAGVTHWYNLIKEGYVEEGYETLGEVIAKYAPCNKNNINDYIADVTDFVMEYRDVSSCPITV